MRKIRIENDIVIRVTVTRDGEAESFDGKTVRMFLRSPYERLEMTYTRIGNVLIAVWLGTQQKKTGVYSVTVTEDYGDGSRNTADECEAFALVSHSCQEDVQTGRQTVASTLDMKSCDTLTNDIDIAVSAPSNGLSAYEIAVQRGFEGTEEEWIASLKGKNGGSFICDFSGYVRGIALSEGECVTPDFIAFDTDTGTFVAAVKGDAILYYPTFMDCDGVAPDDYGTASAKGIAPVKRRMYLDTETDTLVWWSGTELKELYEELEAEDLSLS